MVSQSSPKQIAPATLTEQRATKPQKRGLKRASPAEEGSKKRQKKDTKEEKLSKKREAPEAKRPAAKSKGRKSKSAPSAKEDSNEVEIEAEPVPEEHAPTEEVPTVITSIESESEMSVVIDEKPKPKGKSRNSSVKSAPKKSTGSKVSKGTEELADPDAEEIKRLQGWLTKCGIRKMWYKELAPYGTPKLKINHLKEMLSDAGMSGRYSMEKANQIRNERELKADLEAVQEGDKHWGKAESEEEGTSKPRRRLARGLKELDFLVDHDGEETD